MCLQFFVSNPKYKYTQLNTSLAVLRVYSEFTHLTHVSLEPQMLYLHQKLCTSSFGLLLFTLYSEQSLLYHILQGFILLLQSWSARCHVSLEFSFGTYLMFVSMFLLSTYPAAHSLSTSPTFKFIQIFNNSFSFIYYVTFFLLNFLSFFIFHHRSNF